MRRRQGARKGGVQLKESHYGENAVRAQGREELRSAGQRPPENTGDPRGMQGKGTWPACAGKRSTKHLKNGWLQEGEVDQRVKLKDNEPRSDSTGSRAA